MKYLRFFVSFFVLLCGIIAKSETPKGIPKPEEDFATKEVHESLQRYIETLTEIELMSPAEAIPKLNEMMVRTFRWQDDESMAVYKSAQQKLLSIPGHAKYFTDPIEEAYESDAKSLRIAQAQPEWQALMGKIENTDEGAEVMFNLNSHLWGDYRDISSKNLSMLGHIPSTESVRALGHYLRKRDEPEIKKYNSPETGFSAAKSLTEMVSDGPIQIWIASWEDVPRWEKWFDEVKAGKRTFRFVGSDVDYTLDGPANAATLKRIKERNSSTQRPNITKKPVTPSNDPTHTNQKGPVFHVGLLAAILVCLASFIYYFRRRHIA